MAVTASQIASDYTNELDISETPVPYSIPTSSRPSILTTDQFLSADLNHASSPTSQMSQRNLPLIVHESLIIMAGIIVAIQAQLFTSNSVVTTSISRRLLSIGMIFELHGALLAIAGVFLRIHSEDSLSSRSSLSRGCIIFWLPVVLISTGIVGLTVVLIMETFKV